MVSDLSCCHSDPVYLVHEKKGVNLETDLYHFRRGLCCHVDRGYDCINLMPTYPCCSINCTIHACMNVPRLRQQLCNRMNRSVQHYTRKPFSTFRRSMESKRGTTSFRYKENPFLFYRFYNIIIKKTVKKQLDRSGQPFTKTRDSTTTSA